MALVEVCSTIAWGTAPQYEPCEQYAAELLESSSEYGTGKGNWGAACVLGEPSVYPRFGDWCATWAPSTTTGLEKIAVRLARPMRLRELHVYETFNGDGLTAVRVRAPGAEEWTTVFSREPNTRTPATTANIFKVPVTYAHLVQDICLEADFRSGWNGNWYEIDAIKAIGTAPIPRPKYVPPAPGTLSGDMLQLLLKGEGADVTFVCPDGHQLPAHKAVLLARCPELYRLANTQHALVMVRDDASVFQLALAFVYSGDVQVPSELSVPLFQLAKRLQLEQLMEKSRCAVVQALTVANVTDVLKIVTEAEDLRPLRTACLEFMAEALPALAALSGAPSTGIRALSTAEAQDLLLVMAAQLGDQA